MRYRVVVFALLLVASLPGSVAVVGAGTSSPAEPGVASGEAPALAAGTTPATATTPTAETGETGKLDGDTTAMADADDILHQRTELHHLPDRPGEFAAELTFEIPAPMSGLEIDLPAEAELRAAEDFEETAEGTYRWTEGTDAPTIRFAMPADRTGEVRYHAGEGSSTNTSTNTANSDDLTTESTASADRDGYTFVDTGDWGVVQVPNVGITFQKPASVDIGIEESVAVDGPGATGGDIAYFGPVTEHERTVDATGETIRLVVADDADLEESPAAILEALAAASERLEVGERPAETTVVAVPTDVDWGPRGVQYGAADAWVRADAGLETPSNVWLHEYVHVRQGFADGDVATDARWVVEAQAEYYASLLAYEQELVSFTEFSRFLERGERSPYADGVLAEPSTWEDPTTDYVKGPLVYGELDRQTRLATDGDRNLDDVFRVLNAADGTVTEAEFLGALEAAAGEDVREIAEQHTRTAKTPDAWSRSDHRDAFDRERTAVETGLGADPIEVAGHSWERWDRGDLEGVAADIGHGDVLAVPAGERVTVPMALTNVDDRAGTADAVLQANGEIVALESHALAAGEATTATLEWTPTDPGIYDVRIGDDRLTVFVRSTPSLAVTDLTLEPDGADAGQPITATASVETADRYPAAGVLEFRSAAGVTPAEPIALAPGETGSAVAELTFADDGRYEVTVGDASTTVTVGGPLADLEAISGFGIGVAIVALLAVALLGRRDPSHRHQQ